MFRMIANKHVSQKIQYVSDLLMYVLMSRACSEHLCEKITFNVTVLQVNLNLFQRETEIRHRGLDRAAETGAESKLRRGRLLPRGAARVRTEGAESTSPAEAAERSGLPVLPTAPV